MSGPRSSLAVGQQAATEARLQELASAIREHRARAERARRTFHRSRTRAERALLRDLASAEWQENVCTAEECEASIAAVAHAEGRLDGLGVGR